MASLRQDFLNSVQNEDPATFLNFLEQHRNKHEGFDVNEVLSVLSHKQHDQLWSNLQTTCTMNILGIDPEAEDEALEHICEVLQAIISVATVAISQEAPYVPQQLFETTVMLHGVLLTLPESLDKLQNSIAKLCEQWYASEVEGRDDLVSQTIMYLLNRCLRTKTTLVDIKRVWTLRQSLLLIDFANQSSDDLKDLLVECMTHMPFVKCEKGRRFLSFLFGMNPGFIERLHKTIKSQLPYCSKSVLDWYSDVYFCAWRSSSGVYLEKIETCCIQDLMYCAVHAQRGSSKSLAFALRRVLSCFHKEKKQRGVDEMLLKLYEPIIWRSLKVANGSVRANAATLLIEAFPLHDPDATIEQIDQLMQKQFDILLTLLNDPCPVVRVVAVHGVCRVCNVFWEMIPAQTIRAFLGKLVNDLAWDSSSADVRAAVFQGLTSLLDNHLSHPLLKAVLPELRNLFHDSSERVRVTFVDLLLKVKGLRAIKFWSVVPVEHLLARLEIDTPPVARRIVSLIFNSFMPVDKDKSTQIDRCIAFLETNPRAARRFYQYAHRHMSLEETARFILLLCRCLRECVAKEKQDSSQGASHLDDTEEKENEMTRELSVKDTTIMTGFLETVAVLWAGIHWQLQKPGNADIERKLQVKFSQSLRDFFNVFDSPKAYDTLVFIAGFLPSIMAVAVSQSCLSKLKSLPVDCSPEEYGTMLESLCKWGKHWDVLELISDWLTAGLQMKPDGEHEKEAKTAKRGRRVTFNDPIQPQPVLALNFLTHLIKDSVCHGILLEKAKPQLREITDLLKTVKVCIEKRLVSSGPLNDLLSDEFLVKAFESYCKMEVVLYDPDEKESTTITAFEQLLTWVDMELLFMLTEDRKPELQKRTAAEADAPVLVNLTVQLVKNLLVVSSNMLLVGIGDQEFASQLASFATVVLEKDFDGHALPLVVDLLYQITEHTFTHQIQEADEGVGSHGDIVPGMMGRVIKCLANLIQKDTPKVDVVLSSVKPAMTGILQIYYTRHCMDTLADQHDIMGTIISAIIVEMSNAIREEVEFDECTNISSLPKLTGCLLGMIAKKNTLLGAFTQQLQECVKSGVLQDSLGHLSVLHLLNTLSKAKPSARGLKDCLLSIQTCVEALPTPESEEEMVRQRYEASKALLQNCCQTLGMVV